MSRPIAFYAPLKPPDHPVPSGDRRMARLLMAALRKSGHEVELAARLRSYDRHGDPRRQMRMARLGRRLAARLMRRYLERPAERRPSAWVTYHAYHKSPDWLGPRIADRLGIPYLLIEASFAGRQASGPWALGHRASARAIGRADVVLAMTAVDAQGLAPLVHPPACLIRLAPFVDAAPLTAAAGRRETHRAQLAFRLRLDPALPWLLTVAMMRADIKRASYDLLTQALGRLTHRPWQILVVGDGPARAAIEAEMHSRLPGRAVFTGALAQDELPACYAACDVFVWPALGEAYGLAMLEAQAAGLPVIAGRAGGVAEVVADGVGGLLVPAHDPSALAEAMRRLLDRPDKRAALSARALAWVRRERGLDAAAATLGRALSCAETIARHRR